MLRKYPFNAIAFGGDYNPEQWPEETWQEDVRLMHEARVNLLSVGIFSWAKLEPSPGCFEFDWLSRILNLLHENGISVCLATATASPPPWFSRLHPESLPITETGVRLEIGSRQHYCPTHAAYREAAVRLCREIAKRYAHHPSVVMWHLNNEYANHVPYSYDAESTANFRMWLQRRHGTLEALNRAWGTSFWSQQYGDWEEIQSPRQAPTFVNPAQALDFCRFTNDAWRELCRLEIATVREFNAELPVTTNFMGNLFKPVDQFSWAADLDLCAWDSYPDPTDKDFASFAAAGHDLTRSLRGGQPFFLMEQATTQVNWRPFNALKPPGLMRAQSWQAVARGADAVMFFQWRASTSGAEKYHSAMVPHTGTKSSRIWSEVCGLGRELDRCGEIVDSRVPSRAGILFDWENWWAVEMPAKPRLLSYPEILLPYYRSFHGQNIPVDFVSPVGNLSSYDVLVAPLLYLLDEPAAENIRTFVRRGGILLMTWFGGIVDAHDRVIPGGYPGKLRELLGIRVLEWQPLEAQSTCSVDILTSEPVGCGYWADLLETDSAEILGTFDEELLAGFPSLTRNNYGEGQAWYAASQFEPRYISSLIRYICEEKGVDPVLNAPPGVEASIRQKGSQRWLFVTDLSGQSSTVNLDRHAGVNLLDGRMLAGTFQLEPYGVRIIRLKDAVTTNAASIYDHHPRPL